MCVEYVEYFVKSHVSYSLTSDDVLTSNSTTYHTHIHTHIVMGWIDSIWGTRSNDPLGTLDPKVRDFLTKESPSFGKPDPPPASQHAHSDDTQSLDSVKPAKPKVPRESLFPDGRYAHIWKTYTPLAEIESSTKSDSQKITDIVDAFKERKKEIGRAALENCVETQELWRTCVDNGSWWDRSTGCSESLRKFERCYQTNAVGF